MISLEHGDCRQMMAGKSFDMILADPPYGDTALKWDKRVAGWLPVAYAALKKTGSMWVFGSMRFFMFTHGDFRRAGFRVAQDIVWEKHNGSNFLADRFRRVHEHAVHFYRKDAAWSGVYNDPQKTMDAVARTVVRNKQRPPHLGAHGDSTYRSEDGGPKMTRSVVRIRSCHGNAIHPTEKPVSLLSLLVLTSTPPPWISRRFFRGLGLRRRGVRHVRAQLLRLRQRRRDGQEGAAAPRRESLVKISLDAVMSICYISPACGGNR